MLTERPDRPNRPKRLFIPIRLAFARFPLLTLLTRETLHAIDVAHVSRYTGVIAGRRPGKQDGRGHGRRSTRCQRTMRTEHRPPPRVAAAREKESLAAQLAEQMAQHPEVLFAYLHGSFIGEGPFRDIDLAVYVAPGAAPPDRLRWYECELATDLQSRVTIPVDVRILNDAPLTFRYQVLKGKALLARDVEVLEEFRARTWDDYLDFAPSAHRYLREALVE